MDNKKYDDIELLRQHEIGVDNLLKTIKPDKSDDLSKAIEIIKNIPEHYSIVLHTISITGMISILEFFHEIPFVIATQNKEIMVHSAVI